MRSINIMTKFPKIALIATGLSVSGIVLAGGQVPEMDAGLVPVVLGITVALVMLVKDRMKK
jgi:hypothetical protein